MKNLQLKSHLMVNVFHQKSGVREGLCTHDHYSTLKWISSQCSKARRKNKGHRDLKRGDKTLFVSSISVYIECSKESPEKKEKLLKLTS